MGAAPGLWEREEERGKQRAGARGGGRGGKQRAQGGRGGASKEWVGWGGSCEGSVCCQGGAQSIAQSCTGAVMAGLHAMLQDASRMHDAPAWCPSRLCHADTHASARLTCPLTFLLLPPPLLPLCLPQAGQQVQNHKLAPVLDVYLCDPWRHHCFPAASEWCWDRHERKQKGNAQQQRTICVGSKARQSAAGTGATAAGTDISTSSHRPPPVACCMLAS